MVQSLLSNDPNATFVDRGVFLVRPIPEPGTLLMLGLGLLGLGYIRRS